MSVTTPTWPIFSHLKIATPPTTGTELFFGQFWALPIGVLNPVIVFAKLTQEQLYPLAKAVLTLKVTTFLTIFGGPMRGRGPIKGGGTLVLSACVGVASRSAIRASASIMSR